MTTPPAPFTMLREEFALLQSQLAGFRSGAERGLTALRFRLGRLTVAALSADSSGAYLAVNAAAAELTGFSVDELEAMKVWDITPAPDAETGRRLWAAFLEIGEQHGFYTLHGRNGNVPVAYFARAHVLANVHLSLLVRA